MSDLILIIHDVRSCHNVGAMMRTAEGLGVSEVIMTGYTPYPKMAGDSRLPHIAEKMTRQISKTSLGAEKTIKWRHHEDVTYIIDYISRAGYVVAALEQTGSSIKLPGYKPPEKLAIIVGNEPNGLDPEVIEQCDLALEIPMVGKKESFNVASAAAIALAHVRFYDKIV